MPAPLAAPAAFAAAGTASDAVAGLSRRADPRVGKARETAREFETLFLEQTLDRMIASVGEDGPLGENGAGGGVYRSLLVKEYAGTLAKSGGVGIADQVFRELMRLQETHAHSRTTEHPDAART